VVTSGGKGGNGDSGGKGKGEGTAAVAAVAGAMRTALIMVARGRMTMMAAVNAMSMSVASAAAVAIAVLRKKALAMWRRRRQPVAAAGNNDGCREDGGKGDGCSMAGRTMSLVTVVATAEAMMTAMAAVHWFQQRQLWCWQCGKEDNNNSNIATTGQPSWQPTRQQHQQRQMSHILREDVFFYCTETLHDRKEI
jgi:hypothetical protein